MTVAMRRRAVLVATAILVASLGVVAVPQPASANHDGAAAFAGSAGLPYGPMTLPTTGGVTRIFGNGFHGVSAVRFGGNCRTQPNPAAPCPVVDSPAFSVIDDVTAPGVDANPNQAGVQRGDLIFAKVPPRSNNTFVDVTLIDPEGNATNPLSFFYTNGTASATADPADADGQPGLDDNQRVRFRVSNYAPNATAAIAESAPVVAYVFPRPTALPPPYVDPLPIEESGGTPTAATDASGNLAAHVSPRTGAAFNPDGDPIATCPPTQEQVNLGMFKCQLAWSQFGLGVIAATLDFEGDRTPAPPTLGLAPTTGLAGASVTLSGANWNANPNFGSAATPTRPGETPITVEVCNPDATGCLTAPSNATVGFLLYNVSAANGQNGTFSGSTLGGSFTVPSGGCTGNCLVRVRQQVGPQVAGGPPSGSFREATAPLSVEPGEVPSTTTTTTTTTTTSSTTTTSVPSTTTTTVPPPTVSPGGVVPDYGPPGGGTPVRIYGSGFADETSGPPEISFGGEPASKVTVVDDTLITAVTPPGTRGRSEVRVTTSRGMGNLTGEEGFFYGDPTVQVSPSTDLRPGQEVNVAWSGLPNYLITVVEQASPLGFVVEPRPHPGGSEQVSILRILIGANPSTTTKLKDPFIAVDGGAKCPPTQEQANAGLVDCYAVVRPSAPLFGPPPPKRTPNAASPIPLAGRTAPEEPLVEVGYDAGAGKLLVSGRNWSASPQFGSSTSPDDEAGETLLTIEICGLGGNAESCTATGGTGDVALTRYKYDYECKSGTLEGGRLEGSIAADQDMIEGCEDCMVRVRQYTIGDPNKEFIEATAPLSEAKEGPVTTHTDSPAVADNGTGECPGPAGVVTTPTLPVPPNVLGRTVTATSAPTTTTTVASPAPPRTGRPTAAAPAPPAPPGQSPPNASLPAALRSLFGPRRPGAERSTGGLLTGVALGVGATLVLAAAAKLRSRREQPLRRVPG